MVHYKSETHTSKVLQNLFLSKHNSDVVLISRGNLKCFEAHRAILSAGSGYFERVFREYSVNSRYTALAIDGISPESLECVLKYLYCGSIEIKTVAEAKTYWKIGHSLEILGLVKAAMEVVNKEIDLDSCLELAVLAKKHNDDKILENAAKFIITRFAQVQRLEQFKSLDPIIFLDWFKLIHHKVPEDAIVDAIIAWIKLKPNYKMDHFDDLLKIIDIPRIKSLSVMNRLMCECTSVDHMRYLVNAMAEKAFRQSVPLFRPSEMFYNQSCQMAVIENNREKTLRVFNVLTNEWVVYNNTAPLHGRPIGVWKGCVLLLLGAQLIKFSYKTKTKREIGTYKDLMKPLPIVIQGDCLYAVKDKFLFLVYLRTGKMEKITVNEHKFITLVVYREEMYFFVRTATRRGKVIQIGIDFKTSFESSGFDIDRENGSAVAVNGIIYYFDGRVLEYRIERRESFTTHFRFKRLKNVIAIQDRIFGVDNKRDILEFIPTSYSNEVIWRSELHDIHICPIRNNSMF